MTTALPVVAPVSTASSATPVAGSVIDARYEVVRPIATGGMGHVLEARHVLTGRPVAIKILRRELSQRPDIVARLEREGRALGAIRHPGVVEILDLGTCWRHGPYLALEMLDGRALDGLLAARRSLGPAGALTILRSVTEALVEVHRRGFVHRDVKPANIFVTRRGGVEAVKLLDFGVVGEQSPGTDTRLTAAGDLLGTLGYMAPEQLLEVTLADPRSDLHSLALVVLECMGVALELSSQLRRGRRPATAALGDASGLPAHVIALLDDMLQFDRHARPALAAEVLDRLGDAGLPPTELLGYGAAPSDDTAPTQCEPASRRAHMTLGEGRRKQRRAPYITPVRLLAGGEMHDGRTEDVSGGGMMVVVRGAPRDDGLVEVRFALPTTGRVVSIRATSRWRREQHGRTALGLSFEALDPAVADELERYVRFIAADA